MALDPAIGKRIFLGREITDGTAPAQHFYDEPHNLIPGDGIYHEGESHVVRSTRTHSKGTTVVVEPRKGAIGRTVMSQMQFGVPGITLEDTDERAFTFPEHSLVARRG